MRKREILRHYKSSLEKWEFALCDVKNKANKDYHHLNNQCGFCKVYRDSCKQCPLYNEKTKQKYCPHTVENFVDFANVHEWTKTIKIAKALIAKIKREIKKVENKV